MSDMLISILTGFIVGLCWVLLVAILLRILPRIAPVLIFVLSILFSEIVLFFFGLMLFDRFYFWQASAIFGLIGVTNFFLYGAVYKSVSLEILTHLAAQPNRKICKQHLIEAVARPCVEQRMELIVELGLATKSNQGQYQLTLSGLEKVKQLNKIQNIFGIHESGLYGKT